MFYVFHRLRILYDASLEQKKMGQTLGGYITGLTSVDIPYALRNSVTRAAVNDSLETIGLNCCRLPTGERTDETPFVTMFCYTDKLSEVINTKLKENQRFSIDEMPDIDTCRESYSLQNSDIDPLEMIIWYQTLTFGGRSTSPSVSRLVEINMVP